MLRVRKSGMLKTFYNKTYPGQIILFFLDLIATASPLVLPVIYKNLIDKGITSGSYPTFWKMSIALIVATMGKAILTYIVFLVEVHYLTKNYLYLNDFFFTRFLRIKENILKKKTGGEFQTILNNDINSILNYVTNTFPRLLSQILFAGGAFCLIIQYDLKIALVTFLTTGLMVLISFYYLEKNDAESVGMRDGFKDKSDFLITTYDYSHYIKINKLVELFKKMYLAINNKYYRHIYVAAKNEEKSRQTNDFLGDIVRIVILIMVGKSILEGNSSIGVLVALQVLVPNFYSPILFALNIITAIGRQRECLRRLSEFSQYEQENSAGFKMHDVTDIAIENLRFSFDSKNGGKVLYNNLSDSMKMGRINIIKGSNGSGKSTLLKILTGCYETDSGSIRINNENIRNINLDHYRDKFHYVPQTPFIMKGTIFENIVLKDPIDKKEVIKILNTAGLTDYLESVGSLDRIVSAGKELSGGEKQFIELARMLISKAPIVVLDEPQAAMDGKMKDIFVEQVIRINRATAKTFLIVSHTDFVIPDMHIIQIE